MAKYIEEAGLRKLIQLVKLAFTKGVSYDSSTRKLQETRYALSGTSIVENTTDIVQLAPVATSGSYNDLSNRPTIPEGVSPYDGDIKMNGTKSPGSSTLFARGDHVHPTDTSRAASSHSHGNITNGGDITASAPTVASGDKLIINDESASKITNGPSFGTDTTKYLRNDGSWTVPPNTTYNDFDGANHGLVPVGPTPSSVGRGEYILLQNGDWVYPRLDGWGAVNGAAPGYNIDLCYGDSRSDTSLTVLDSINIPFASVSDSGGIMSADESDKLAGISPGADVNVQSDWNQSDTTADDYIKNKPTLPTVPGDFTGATSSAAGTHGLVPAPGSNHQNTLLFGDAAWNSIEFASSSTAARVTLQLRRSISAMEKVILAEFPIPNAGNAAGIPGLMIPSDWDKLNGIAAGAEVNVQSDWNQTTTTADDYIKHKPTLGTAAAKNVGSVADGNTGLVTGDAVYDAIQSSIAGIVGNLVYKGAVSSASGMTNFKKGWSWIASASFTIGSDSSAKNVEAGDMLIANADGSSATTSNIDVIQTNIDTLTTTEIEALWNAA